MAYRNIYITKPSSISIEQNNLSISQEDVHIRVPIEDMLTIMLEDRSTSFSSYALAKLAENDVLIYFCDRTHLPCAVLTPFALHTVQVKRIRQQINISTPIKKQIWKEIVKAKIVNQSLCLKYTNSEHEDIEGYTKRVLSGDSNNIEAQVARKYFNRLFGEDFTRDQDCLINSCLNYGYAILRGLVARSLVVHGFEPSLGVHHKNELNNFCLADDLIEPLRPIVDLFTKNININSITSTLDRGLKARLYDIINHTISFSNETHSVATATDLMIESLVRSIDSNDPRHLQFPTLQELHRHSYE
ncbi:MAG: type II CRISPR-associated endonuclease Cas1 [Patescibacteria group bacterium]